MRPVSASLTLRAVRTLAEPVSRKRPGVRSLSTASLMASSRSGARWTSSMNAGPLKPAMNPSGSARAASRVARTSRLSSSRGMPRSCNLAGQRALAHLPCPGDEYDARVGKRLEHQQLGVAGKHVGGHGHKCKANGD